jgi:hypothetical protein
MIGAINHNNMYCSAGLAAALNIICIARVSKSGMRSAALKAGCGRRFGAPLNYCIAGSVLVLDR